MDRTITIQIPDHTIALLQEIVRKLPSESWIAWAPWAAVAATVFTVLVSSWVQFWLAKRSFHDQLALAEEKERAAARRRYLEDAYRELLTVLVDVEDTVVAANQNHSMDNGWRLRVQRSIRRLRMQIDFTNSCEMIGQFSVVDRERRQLEDTVIARIHQDQGPKLPIDHQQFAVECDNLQNMLKARLANLKLET